MKRFLFVLILAVLAINTCFADNLLGKKIPFNQLPSNSQVFFNKHFKTNSITLVKVERDKYEVKFNKNDEVEFYKKNGEWSELKCEEGIPESILSTIPSSIVKYVKNNYPKFKIVDIDRTKGYDVELENGLELEFMPDGKFIKMKK